MHLEVLLTPKNVEVLICSQDWIRKSRKDIEIDEELDDYEDIAKGMNF